MHPPLGALILLLALSSTAHAGIVRGVVRVRAVDAHAPAANAYPGRAGSLPGNHAPARGMAADAVVYVEHLPAAAESALAAGSQAVPKLAQKDQQFVPRVLAVPVGGRVDFPNQDPIYHNVFSLSPARRFDLGKYPKGGSRQVRFPRAGLVKVYCDIHSDMEAFVLVVPNHAIARPGPSGDYELPELPAGTYVLRAWHPDLGEKSARVEVSAHGEVRLDLDL